MQMDNRTPRFDRAHRGILDLLCCHWKMLRHRRCVNRAGHSAGDDDLVVLCHDFSPL
jgi:hypothetical protein